MGIPSYFSHIVKKYPDMISKFNSTLLLVHSMYLDSNSIIYDSFHALSKEDETIINNIPLLEQLLIESVIKKIDEYISILQPTHTIFIAFDGVAPIAKLKQQRNRRYKTAYQTNMINHVLKKKCNPLSNSWSTAAITPGTQFMQNLNIQFHEYYQNVHLLETFEVKQIILSGSDEPGEGEHKIFEHIRNREKIVDDNIVIYGLDSDLIMLGLNHLEYSNRIFLFRETPHFIGSLNSELEPNQHYLLDIYKMAIQISNYLTNSTKIDSFDFKKVKDYIFLCFFLGNDFLPHFPATNIRTNGIETLMGTYKAIICDDEYLVENNSIIWGNVRKIVTALASQEERYIVQEYNLRNSRERRNFKKETPEEKIRYIENIPTFQRDLERYIEPVKPGWECRYYDALFGPKIESMCENNLNLDENEVLQLVKTEISQNFLEGLEWTLAYYSSGCLDWSWKYQHCYPPLYTDLLFCIPIYETQFIKGSDAKPLPPLVQLCYVLPREHLSLLPHNLKTYMLKSHADWYPVEQCRFLWAYCKYLWESHVVLPEINIDELVRIIETL